MQLGTQPTGAWPRSAAAAGSGGAQRAQLLPYHICRCACHRIHAGERLRSPRSMRLPPGRRRRRPPLTKRPPPCALAPLIGEDGNHQHAPIARKRQGFARPPLLRLRLSRAARPASSSRLWRCWRALCTPYALERGLCGVVWAAARLARSAVISPACMSRAARRGRRQRPLHAASGAAARPHQPRAPEASRAAPNGCTVAHARPHGQITQPGSRSRRSPPPCRRRRHAAALTCACAWRPRCLQDTPAWTPGRLAARRPCPPTGRTMWRRTKRWSEASAAAQPRAACFNRTARHDAAQPAAGPDGLVCSWGQFCPAAQPLLRPAPRCCHAYGLPLAAAHAAAAPPCPARSVQRSRTWPRRAAPRSPPARWAAGPRRGLRSRRRTMAVGAATTLSRPPRRCPTARHSRWVACREWQGRAIQRWLLAGRAAAQRSCLWRHLPHGSCRARPPARWARLQH